MVAHVNYSTLSAIEQGYSASSGYYHVVPDADTFYTPDCWIARCAFRFAVPPPQTAKTGLKDYA